MLEFPWHGMTIIPTKNPLGEQMTKTHFVARCERPLIRMVVAFSFGDEPRAIDDFHRFIQGGKDYILTRKKAARVTA